jgi:hypothetical protein
MAIKNATRSRLLDDNASAISWTIRTSGFGFIFNRVNSYCAQLFSDYEAMSLRRFSVFSGVYIEEGVGQKLVSPFLCFLLFAPPSTGMFVL